MKCEKKGCCYGPTGGVDKCTKCNNEYKQFIEGLNKVKVHK